MREDDISYLEYRYVYRNPDNVPWNVVFTQFERQKEIFWDQGVRAIDYGSPDPENSKVRMAFVGDCAQGQKLLKQILKPVSEDSGLEFGQLTCSKDKSNIWK